MVKSKRNILAAAVAVLAVVGGGYSYFAPNEIERAAQSAIRVHLIDPDSLKFEVLSQTEQELCGLFNGRNRMGGYSGATPFIYRKFLGAEAYTDKANSDAVKSLQAALKMSMLSGDFNYTSRGHSVNIAITELSESCNFIGKWDRLCAAAKSPFASEDRTICREYKKNGPDMESFFKKVLG